MRLLLSNFRFSFFRVSGLFIRKSLPKSFCNFHIGITYNSNSSSFPSVAPREMESIGTNANPSPKSLSHIEGFLNRWLRPVLYGEPWDNIGLLIGSGHQTKEKKMVSSILVCNDLTTTVTDEAIQLGVQLIIAYHPPIFSPMKRIGFSWKDSIISKCLAHDISVYSPHTMLDSVAFGINDSIIRMLTVLAPNLDDYSINSVIPSSSSLAPEEQLIYKLKSGDAVNVFEKLKDVQDVSFGFNVEEMLGKKTDEVELSLFTSRASLSQAGLTFQIIEEVNKICKEEVKYQLKKGNLSNNGAGRKIVFKTPKKLSDIQKSLQTYMNIEHIKVADSGKEIYSAAVCAGSGGSLLKEVNSDLIITGELSHHEVLDFVENKKSVILCGHANSERHYLPTMAQVLKTFINCPNVHVSKCDQNLLQWI